MEKERYMGAFDRFWEKGNLLKKTIVIDNTFYEKLNELAKTKTIVMIAHSLELLEDFDNIIMLDNGKIVEQGKHDELINNHGKYYELANV